jgi:hypothetical protein
MTAARVRHSITRVKTAAPGPMEGLWSALTSRVAFLIYGFVLGVVLALAWR